MFAPAYDYAPSGELTLRVGGRYGHAHRSWTDRPRKSLEGRLGEAVIGIEQVARLQGQEEKRREESRRQWEQERREREIAQIREQYERELAKDLVQMSTAWRESRNLRVFLDRVEEGLPEEIKTTAGFRAWIGWARGYAERRDPLTQPQEIAKRIEPEFLRTLGQRPVHGPG